MISSTQLSQAIHNAGFPLSKRKEVNSIVRTGLEQFREYEKNWYYSHTGKKIKKPSPAHKAKIGRYDQTAQALFDLHGRFKIALLKVY